MKKTVFKWVLRGGRMQRQKEVIKVPDPKPVVTKETKKERRQRVNKDLIELRHKSELTVGENIIAEFLKSNCVDFKKEHHFKDLFNNYTNKFLFFDFYLPGENLVIEFDGEFHYKPIGGKEALEKRKRLDRIKNNYCKRKRIRILRIPYWKRDRIETIICQYFDNHL